MRKAYQQYVEIISDTTNSVNEKLTSNKKFWQFIRGQKQEAQKVDPLKKDGRAKLVDDPMGKATPWEKGSPIGKATTLQNTSNDI